MKPTVYKQGKYWFIKYPGYQGYMEYTACVNWETAIENAVRLAEFHDTTGAEA